jgi:hypothetical protein
VNAVMNLRVPWIAGNLLTKWGPVNFSRRTLLIQSVMFPPILRRILEMLACSVFSKYVKDRLVKEVQLLIQLSTSSLWE